MKFNYQSHSLKSGIYKITNTHSDRIYIGQAKRLKERWASHSAGLRSNKHQNKFLQNDFNKCKEELGHDDFLVFEVIEVMEDSTKEQRNIREEWWISQHYDNQNSCYNIREKVEDKERSCNSKTPEETKKKLSEAMKKRWEDPEYQNHISESMKRNWSDPNHKASVSQLIKDAKNTPEEKAKMSERSKANWENPEYREKFITAFKVSASTEEYKEKRKKSLLKRKEDKETWAEYQKKISEHSKQLHASGIMKKTEETKQKMSESAKKRHAENRNQTLIQNQFKAKSHTVIDSDGNIITINNLKEFCLINQLDYNKFRSMAGGRRKEYKGYYPTVSRKPSWET